jgi:hypothetical protein
MFLANDYLLTPWSRVLLEKLTVNFAASQEIPHIYGTRKFLTCPDIDRPGAILPGPKLKKGVQKSTP